MKNPIFEEFLKRIRHHASLKSFTRQLSARQISRLQKALQAEIDERDASKIKEIEERKIKKNAAERLSATTDDVNLKEAFNQLSKRYN